MALRSLIEASSGRRLSSMRHDRPKGEAHRVIVELKYRPTDDDAARQLTQSLPLRLDKSSKYVEGLRRAAHC